MRRYSRLFRIIFSIALVAAAVIISASLFLNSIYRLPILMYHSIDYTSNKSDRLTVSPMAFERQMRYLHDHGYSIVGLDKVVEYTRSVKAPPRKTVAVTIDDGYENNYKYAYPILKKYRIPATIFIIVDAVDKEGFLDWVQISQMSGSGLIDIESHTMSHPWLTGCDDTVLKYELADSKAIIERRTGKEVKYLCYPMGGYDERVKAAVREAGYKAAFATKPRQIKRSHDLYEIKRVRISSTADNLLVFLIKISGYHSFFKAAKYESLKERERLKVLWVKGS